MFPKLMQISVNSATGLQWFSTQNVKKPYVGRALPGPAGGAQTHSAPQTL